MHDPDILIMDEPVANLDPKARLEFFETLKKLRSEGKAIFISSHVLAELDLYTTSVTVLDGGKVVYSGDKNAIVELYDKNQFFCETNDMPKTLKIVRSMKIKYRRVPESLSYLLKFSNKKQINEFQKAIFRQKLYLIQFKLREQTLDEVYEKLVVKGSVDTMDNK
jgi:ABC-2 type transport system ATP-binding protein